MQQRLAHPNQSRRPSLRRDQKVIYRPGSGFLGTGSTLMLDVVVCALVVPLLAFSIYTVKARRNYLLHRQLQLSLGAALLLADDRAASLHVCRTYTR